MKMYKDIEEYRDTEDVDAFKKYGLSHLYFLMFAENLPSVKCYGLLSKNDIINRNISYKSFAEESVQDKRHTKKITTSTGHKRSIHDMNPFYFTSKTPTFYARIREAKSLIYLIFNISLITDREYCFSDGNAASIETEFYTDKFFIDRIDRTALVQRESWRSIPDGKRKRNAEMLIWGGIDIKAARILCPNQEIRNYCANIVEIDKCSVTSWHFEQDNF